MDLIEERGFDKVTVAQITERAMVSRAAFYRNYRDKYHLVEQIFDEAMAELQGKMGAADAEERPVLDRWIAFFEHLDAYRRMYGALLGRKGSPWFAHRLHATLADMVAPHFPPQEDTALPGLVPAVLSSVFTASITWWLEADGPVPPREIATRSAALAGAVINEVQSWPGPS
ncbi:MULTISPECIES: TetR/AcrR family transcriptional regulator [Streptomyces]|uniref:TetR/AcrR family transcriptional regulator n=1 Tax=Streptomyces lonegramiae TaxID=3075524 RepID=A0ABU2XFG8_9ACTN|nr:TetR/AcrR family transcriptional regulator [Streptomyces sp. DSM 41529]MDT0544668.1 TetR/AcrR family transcriptional regulator [Streptomyces sp. DSM 41529]